MHIEYFMQIKRDTILPEAFSSENMHGTTTFTSYSSQKKLLLPKVFTFPPTIPLRDKLNPVQKATN